MSAPAPPSDASDDLHGHRRPRPRIETLADLIFGVSLGIDAIALLPGSPTSPMDMNGRILIFGFAFLFLITAWLIYTTYMSVLPLEGAGVVFLNVAMLLLVALIPYLLNNVELGVNPAVRDYSSSLFGLDLTGIQAILAVFAHRIGRQEAGHGSPDIARLFHNGRDRMAILAVWTALSAAPFFGPYDVFGVPVRLLMWSVPLISYWGGRALRPDSRTYRLSE